LRQNWVAMVDVRVSPRPVNLENQLSAGELVNFVPHCRCNGTVGLRVREGVNVGSCAIPKPKCRSASHTMLVWKRHPPGSTNGPLCASTPGQKLKDLFYLSLNYFYVQGVCISAAEMGEFSSSLRKRVGSRHNVSHTASHEEGTSIPAESQGKSGSYSRRGVSSTPSTH
jgi:hypothetical protein